MGKKIEECVLNDYNPEIEIYECLRGYRCVKCEKEFAEITKKGKSKNRKCPYCKIILESQILGIGHITVSQEAKTLSQIAERNTKKMGRYEIEDKEKSHYDSRSRGKLEIMKEKGLIDKSTTFQDLDKENQKLKKINNMTPEQKTKYVLTGEGL